MQKNFKFLTLIKIAIGRLEKIGRKAKNNESIGEPREGDLAKAEQESSAEKISTWRRIKYLPKFLSKKEKIILRSALGVIAICLILMGYVFLKANLAVLPKVGGTYTENIVGAPQFVNPLYGSINEADRDLTKLIFAGLVKFDAEQKIVPDLAKEWFVDETGKTYTLRLNDNIYWPDEKKFGSDDVIFTYEALKNPDYQSPLRSVFEGIEIRAIDELTVQFILPEAYPGFIDNLTVGILPSQLWSEILPQNAKLADWNLKPVGLGPFKFDSFVKDKQGFIKSYTLARNENYHLPAPHIEQFIFKFYQTFEQSASELDGKNADGLNFLPINLKESLGSRNDLNFYSLSLPQYTAIFFNTDNNSELGEKKLRQALALATDKNKIAETVLKNEARAINGPILPGMPGYETTADQTTSDAEAAKKLLAELGWQIKEIADTEVIDRAATSSEANGEQTSKFLFKNDRELAITMTVANQPQSVAVAEAIQKYWQAIGIKTKLNIIDPAQIQKDIIAPRKFEALLFGEILGNRPDLFAFWHSSRAGEKGLNLANFKNEAADKLLEKIKKETDETKLAESYVQFSEILNKELPAIFLYNPNYTYVVSNKVKGIDLTRIVTAADRFNEVNKWYIKTKKGLK